MILLFILTEIYHLIHRDKLYVKRTNLEINTNNTLDLIFYASKLFFYLWLIFNVYHLIFGGLSYDKTLFTSVVILELLNIRAGVIRDSFITFLKISILLTMLFI
jgi:hypothetical protein